jgi:hypothetical protein
MTLKVDLPNFTSVHGPLKPPFLFLPLSEVLTLLPLPSPTIWTLEDRRRSVRQKQRLTLWNISSSPKALNVVLSQMNLLYHQLLTLSKTKCRQRIVHRYPRRTKCLPNVLSLNHVRSFNLWNRRHPWTMEQKLWQPVHLEKLLTYLSLKVNQVFFIGHRAIFIHSTEPFEVLEAKEEISLDDNQPIGTQLRQEDVMDVEVEQGALQAASPVTDQSRRDRKLRASRLYTLLIIPDKRKVSEAASIFSDSIRDRKKVREDSQPVDDDEPGMRSPFLIPWSISICHRSRARAPPRTTSCG